MEQNNNLIKILAMIPGTPEHPFYESIVEEIATGRRLFIVWKVLDEVIDPDQQQTVEWEKPVAVYNVEHKNLRN